MPRRPITVIVAAAVVGAALVGCTGGVATKTAARRSSVVPARRHLAAAPVTIAGARRCPVTVGRPVPRAKPWRQAMAGFTSAHANAAGSLWVGGLWPRGVVVIDPA